MRRWRPPGDAGKVCVASSPGCARAASPVRTVARREPSPLPPAPANDYSRFPKLPTGGRHGRRSVTVRAVQWDFGARSALGATPTPRAAASARAARARPDTGSETAYEPHAASRLTSPGAPSDGMADDRRVDHEGASTIRRVGGGATRRVIDGPAVRDMNMIRSDRLSSLELLGLRGCGARLRSFWHWTAR